MVISAAGKSEMSTLSAPLGQALMRGRARGVIALIIIERRTTRHRQSVSFCSSQINGKHVHALNRLHQMQSLFSARFQIDMPEDEVPNLLVILHEINVAFYHLARINTVWRGLY
jgi:hypothetical protein